MTEDEELRLIRRKKLKELMKQMNEDIPRAPVVMTDADFDDTVNKYPVVVVDFWAEWCAPCKPMGAVIAELAQTYDGKVVFGKLNVDENPATSTKFRIMAIPTLLVFHNGKLVDQLQGAMPAPMVTPTIDKYVS